MELGRLPVRPLLRSAWTTAVAGSVVNHMSPRERQTAADLDSVFSDFDVDIKQEDALWAMTRVVEERPGRISDFALEDAAVATAKLQNLSGYNAAVERFGLNRIRSLNIMPDYSPVVPDDDAARASRALMMHHLVDDSLCKPLL